MVAFKAVKFIVCHSEGKEQRSKLAPCKWIRIQTVQEESVKVTNTWYSLPLTDRHWGHVVIQKKMEET